MEMTKDTNYHTHNYYYTCLYQVESSSTFSCLLLLIFLSFFFFKGKFRQLRRVTFVQLGENLCQPCCGAWWKTGGWKGLHLDLYATTKQSFINILKSLHSTEALTEFRFGLMGHTFMHELTHFYTILVLGNSSCKFKILWSYIDSLSPTPRPHPKIHLQTTYLKRKKNSPLSQGDNELLSSSLASFIYSISRLRRLQATNRRPAKDGVLFSPSLPVFLPYLSRSLFLRHLWHRCSNKRSSLISPLPQYITLPLTGGPVCMWERNNTHTPILSLSPPLCHTHMHTH